MLAVFFLLQAPLRSYETSILMLNEKKLLYTKLSDTKLTGRAIYLYGSLNYGLNSVLNIIKIKQKFGKTAKTYICN